MNSREEKDGALRSHPQRNPESPFLEEEIFDGESEDEWEARLATLEMESPFQRAFEEGLVRDTPYAEEELLALEEEEDVFESEEPEKEFVEEEERATVGDFPVEEAEAYDEEARSDRDSLMEVYDQDEVQYVEGETEEEKALARMKFELQTKNRIWRNDGKTASLLDRKYGPNDFLVDKNGVRLESETHGVLEFETEWFRTWPKLKEAIEKAVKMTEDMNNAGPSKFEKTRKAFPFNVDHLRKGSTKEKSQGFWDRRKGMEGEKEKILGAKEELEVEIIDDKWMAGIQSSESFLLEYYESFLRQHEWPFFRDGTIKHAKAILDAANTDGIHVTELAKLRSFLQIIVNYIMRGQGGKVSKDAGAFADVEGMPAKQAFTLMSRTSFSSMYQTLLTEKEKNLFKKIVKNDLILNEMGLNQQSPVFIKGYGTKRNEPGPTVYKWLSGILSGVDLLSGRSGKGLSAAMGRYDVETRTGKKDRWLVKFETRNTKMGAWKEAKDWVDYASELFKIASKREDDAVRLAHQQGITDENKLTNLVFHAHHPDLKGRRIRKDERDLAQEWLRIRDDLVRMSLQGVQPELEEFEDAEDRYEQSYQFHSDLEEYTAEDEVEVGDDEAEEGIEASELDPVLVDIAEKIIAREVPLFEHQAPPRWTRCFSAEDIAKVQKVYEDNTSAASANSVDRNSCIVMLNVALGQLLSLRLKQNRARGASNRYVQMGNLITETIEKAMYQLRRKGYTVAPTLINFFDRRNHTAGTLKPERLKASVRDKLLAYSKKEGCWFAFSMSIMDGYHSVLLVVDHNAADAKIYWLDQFSTGLDDDVTNSLDQRLTDVTQRWWQAVMDTKRKGYKTTIRLWPLRKPLKTS
jgi:hypothetical protein